MPSSIYIRANTDAERHTVASSFQLTTSILPLNQAPMVSDMEVVTNENTAIVFQLQGYVCGSKRCFHNGLLCMFFNATQL